MSMDVFVAFSGQLPSIAEFETEMARIGFPVVVDKGMASLEEADGYVPMMQGEEESGVELYLWPLSDEPNYFEWVEGATIDPALDRVAHFTFGGDEMEMLCGYFSAAAISSLTGGTVADGESGEAMDAAKAADQAVSLKNEVGL